MIPARETEDVQVQDVEARVFTVPTEEPESDGTLAWEETTAIVVRVTAADRIGSGYTYSHAAAARVVRDTLAPVVRGRSALDVQGAWSAMADSLRNFGNTGIGAAALSAVDIALWDLKARVLNLPLVSLFGAVREAVPVYGSAGFTSEPAEATIRRFAGWAERGITRFKMKVGRHSEQDEARVGAVRDALGDGMQIFVDANGAYRVADAVDWATRFGHLGVTYFEEPVSSDDLPGLRTVRERAPAALSIAAGEYAWSLFDFRRLLEAAAVDILQADVTRCGGFTGFLRGAALSDAWMTPLSTHTAQTLHAHVACATEAVVHMEYFRDHERVERLLFDGVPEPDDGTIRPDLSRAGMGIELKLPDAEQWERGTGSVER